MEGDGTWVRSITPMELDLRGSRCDVKQIRLVAVLLSSSTRGGREFSTWERGSMWRDLCPSMDSWAKVHLIIFPPKMWVRRGEEAIASTDGTLTRRSMTATYTVALVMEASKFIGVGKGSSLGRPGPLKQTEAIVEWCKRNLTWTIKDGTCATF